MLDSRTIQTVGIQEGKKSNILNSVLWLIYVLGVFVMSIRLSCNLLQIRKLKAESPHEVRGKYLIIHLKEDSPSFSIFRYIFLNDNNLNSGDRKDILLHEEIHIKQGHTYDIFFIELCKIIFWFNPVIWEIKKSLSKVHECLVDENVLKSGPECVQDYQSLLLKQYLCSFKIDLANPFNYSLIKFRIAMMTKTKSVWWAKFKLILAIPVIIVGLAGFGNEKINVSSPGISSKGYTDPNGWWYMKEQTSYKVGIDYQAAQNGQKSAFIESVTAHPVMFLTLMQTSSIKEFQGKRIKMTGYLKAQGTVDTTTMWIRIDDYQAEKSLDFDNMWDRSIIGTKDWTKCEIVFDVPVSDCVINYGFLLTGVGKAWFDNITFEIVPSTTLKTAHNLDYEFPKETVKKFYEQYPDGVQEKAPVNLDFEE